MLLILAVSAGRYVVRHHSGPEHLAVLVSAAVIAGAVSWLAVLAGTDRRRPWAAPAVTVAIGALVLVAPSFAWSAVPLVVLLHAEASLVVASVWSALAVTVVALAVPRLTAQTDPGLLLGCLLAGTVFVAVLAGLRAALDSRDRLLAEVMAQRARVAEVERTAGAAAERQRIAAELHDTVVQTAAGALFLVDASERTGAVPDVAGREARAALRSALTQARGLVDRLEDGDPDDVDLTAGLAAAARVVGADFAVRGDVGIVPAAVAHCLVRVAQSALGNAFRHAEAESVTVTLLREDDAVAVIVADDGVGFDVDRTAPPTSAGGHGLAIMRRRCALVGGTLSVRSDGRGTTVTARVPAVSR